MDVLTFQQLLTEEVTSYRALLETSNRDWIVKGFIDVEKKVYTITCDTKVISKILEIILIPRLGLFAQQHDLSLETASKQNYYPDLTFKDEAGHLFAVDFKTSYYGDNGKINGLTLGSYWGYFRHRETMQNMDHLYQDYQCHLVLGVLYKQRVITPRSEPFCIDELEVIQSVVKQFVIFLQPKWKIASDKPGSGNTRNIGSVKEVDKLTNGAGVFAELGEDVFENYWMNYFNKADAKRAGLDNPYYHDLESYKAYLDNQQLIREKLK